MTRTRPSVLNMLVWAYWDLYHALRTAWLPALIATAIVSIGTVAALIGPLFLTRDPIAQALARQTITTGLCFLLTPFLLAIHRLVVLGELTQQYDFTPSEPRFQSYFGWLALAVFIMGVPSLLEALTTPRGPVYYSAGQSFPGPSRSVVVTIIHLAGLVAVQYCLTLLPAVAVDAPGATWQNAVSDTRRHIWFVLMATILPLIPIGLLALAVAPIVGSRNHVGMVVSTLWFGAMLVVALTLVAVVASRLYQLIGNRLNVPLR